MVMPGQRSSHRLVERSGEHDAIDANAERQSALGLQRAGMKPHASIVVGSENSAATIRPARVWAIETASIQLKMV